MWMNSLRLGSIVILCSLLWGCDTSRSEWVHHGEWVYRNESSHKIEIKGAIISWTTLETTTFAMSPAETYCIDFWSDGEKYITPDAIGFPFEDLPKFEYSITIDDSKMILLEPSEAVRNRNNYQVEKLGTNYFRFTYVFTDDNLADLIQ